MKKENEEQIEAPPILGKWSNLYWTVLISLVAWLTIFYIFRRIFE